VRISKGSKIAALAVGLSLIVVACGNDNKSSSDTAAPATTEASTETSTGSTDTMTTDTTGGEGGVAMRITYDIADAAVWNDGSPITADDFICEYNATMNTVGSLSTVGYDQITSIKAGDSDKQFVVEFKSVYAPYRALFGAPLKHDAFADCNDISGDLQTDFPFSDRPYQLDSWSDSQLVMVPNPNYFGDDKAVAQKVVMVPKADQETEINSLLAGETDFIYPQYSPETADAVAGDPNIKVGIVFGGDYEGLYFQQHDGPFADPIYRQAFAQSIDMEAFFQQIYAPIVPNAEPLTCGPIVPDHLREHLRSRRRQAAPHRQRLDPERFGHVGEGRQGPRSPLDDQLGQQPS
jgi:ABC-type oligopeptide transport system substrate-binding subunit